MNPGSNRSGLGSDIQQQKQLVAVRRVAPEHALAFAVVGIALTLTAIVFFFINGRDVDFVVFYMEGLALLTGQPLYSDRSNMNSPALTTFVFAPLALLPYRIAQVVWLVVSVIAVLAGGRLIVRELRLTREQVLCAVGGIGVMHGSFQAWAIGQLTWPLLFYPLTRAWLAYRRGAFARTGAWMGLAVAVKPPLALTAVLLPPPVWLIAGAVSGGISGSAVAFTGLEAWWRWLAAGRQVDWLARPFNASMWAAAARLQVGRDTATPIGMVDLPAVAVVLVLCLLAAIAWQVIRATGDVRFLRASLFSTLASPLGWAYYLPLMAGPAIATWPGRVGVVVILGMLIRFATASDAHLVYDWLLLGSVLLAHFAWSGGSVQTGGYGRYGSGANKRVGQGTR